MAFKDNYPCLSQQGDITIVVLCFAIFKGCVYVINKYTFRLRHVIKLTIPSSAIYGLTAVYYLSPAIVYVHPESSKALGQVLAGEEVIIYSVAVRGEYIGYVCIAIITYHYGICGGASVN